MRHHDIQQDEYLGPLLSFLPQVIADKSQPSVQIFFRKKEALNGASKNLVLLFFTPLFFALQW